MGHDPHAVPGDSVSRILAQWERVRPGLDLAPMGLIGRLTRVSQGLATEIQRVFAEHDLRTGEFDVLATLVRSGSGPRGLTAGELTEGAMVTSGAITNRLDRLVAKGLITRETDPANRRSVRVALTPAGRQRADEALAAHLENEERLLEALDVEQRERLDGLLAVLLAAQEKTGSL